MNSSNYTVNVTTGPAYVITVELWILYITFYIVLGIAATLENLFIIILIAVDKKLRTFFFILIAGHCVGEILHSTGNVIAGIYRLLPASYPNVIIRTRLQCHFISVLLYFAPGFNSLTMVLLALDRSFAIAKPTAYHKYSAKQALILMSICFVFSLFAKVIPSYIGSSTPFSTNIACTTSKVAVTPEWWFYNYVVNSCLIFLSVFLYAVVLVISSLRARSLSNGTFSNDELANRLLKKQLKLLGTIRVLIIINVLTIMPYVVLLIMSNYFPPQIASRLVVYGASLNAVDMAFEPISLYTSSTALKNAFKLLTNRNVIGSEQLVGTSTRNNNTKSNGNQTTSAFVI